MTVQRFLEGLPKRKLGFIEPMKCRLTSSLPRGKEWVYEIKFDGYRALGIKDGKQAALLSRNNKPLNYPAVLSALGKLKCQQLLLDGEVVALDELGRSSFQLLQRMNQPGSGAGHLFYYIFDILNLNGRDTTGLPLRKRKALLEVLLKGAPECLRVSGFLPGGAEAISRKLSGIGLEGIIAKKRDSTYEAAKRSGSWTKFKWSNEQEFVIGGYTEPEGTRSSFGSVLVGYYDAGRLIFAAKVGTGFNEQSLASLYKTFQKLSRPTPAFADINTRRGSAKHSLTPALIRRCHWVEPTLVCECKFTEWTSDGHLRQPVFLGLREDKDPAEVIKETGLRPA